MVSARPAERRFKEMITVCSFRESTMPAHAGPMPYCAYNTLEQINFNHGSTQCAEPIRNKRRPPLWISEFLETKRRLTHSSGAYLGTKPNITTYEKSIQRSSCVTLIRPANSLPRRKRRTRNYFSWCLYRQHITR